MQNTGDSSSTHKKRHVPDTTTNFSLVLGGPLYRLYLRLRLATPPLKLCHKRILAFVALTWLPLLLLSILDGRSVSTIKVPFLFDVAAQIRFLIALTLLLIAEPIVHERIHFIVNQFVERDIITVKYRPTFEGIIASTVKLGNSVVIEIVLMVMAVILGHWIWKEIATFSATTWYSTQSSDLTSLTRTGYWYTFISLPIFQFILLRWYFRLFLWYRFLWKVSQLPLRLNALHPDKAGGLGFLANSTFAFGLVLLAHTALYTGLIANRLWHEGAKLTEFKFEIASIIVFLTIMVFMPLTLFIFNLAHEKRKGEQKYGRLASHYVNDFEGKWMGGHVNKAGVLLGTSDIQSLADLANGFTVGHEMSLVPFSKRHVIQLIILIALPFLPLLLTMMPLEQMISSIIKVIL